jgi:hypothetical protein
MPGGECSAIRCWIGIGYRVSGIGYRIGIGYRVLGALDLPLESGGVSG